MLNRHPSPTRWPALRNSAPLFTALVLALSTALAGAGIVINEVHYNGEPNNAANEFVELYNSGVDPVDLSGWFFNAGINYTFPAGTEVAPGAYLVIAQDPTALLNEFGTTAIGPYASALSGSGETLELRDSAGATVDSVSYRAKFPWPIGAGGSGGSMELIHPSLDNDLGASWRTSTTPGVLSELTLIGTGSAGWRWRPGDSEASSPIEAWRAHGFTEDASWTAQSMPIGYGNVGTLNFSPEIPDMRTNYSSVFLRKSFTIAPGEIPEELMFRYQADDAIIVWINGVEVERSVRAVAGEPVFSDIATGNAAETTIYERTFSGAPGFLVEDENTIAIQLFNVSVSSSDCGLDCELIRPESGADAPPRPTPGARNSVFATSAPPAIRQVDHSPNTPTADTPVLITAKVTDPDGVAAVTLEIQSVAPGAYVPAFLAKPTTLLRTSPNTPRDPNPAYHDPANWTSIAMLDDGTGGDALAGDGVFTASVSGQPNRTLVRYRITVEDSLGASVRVPYADDESLNFAYFVYNGVPDYVAETRSVNGAGHVYPASLIESIPVYHVITTPEDFDQAVAYNSGDQIARDLYDARSAYNWNGTFVYEGKVYDNIGYRLRQRNARYAGTGKRSFKFRFKRGNYPTFRDMDGNEYPTEWKFLASHKMRSSRGNYTWGLEQAANHVLWNMTGTPAPFTHWFNMRVIRGAEEAPSGANGQYLGDHYGMLLAMEEYDSRFLDAHGLDKGNLYKLISGRTDGVSVRRYLGPEAVDDGSDFQNIIFQLRPNKDDAWLNQHVNYDAWNRYHVIVDAVRHYDVAPNTAEHLKNRAYYFEPSEQTPLGRLWVLPWDSDTSWGPNWNGGEDFCKQAIHGTGGNSPRPEFLKEYRNVAREIRDLIWTEEQISLLLDPLAARIADIVPADRDRWSGAVGGSDSLPAIEGPLADMKKFAFDGGAWVGGEGPREPFSKDSGISGQQGRDAYLDVLSADADIPDTPTITYTGAAGFPQSDLAFQSSAFSDPQGAGTFGAMQWRIAEVTPIGGGTFPVLDLGAEWRYLDDGSDQGTAWRAPSFDDSAWATGNTPAGYGGVTLFPNWATDISFGGVAGDRHITTYFRTTVNVDDPSLIERVDFSLLVDDGAVVYVNGIEVFREGFGAAVEVTSETGSEVNGNETTFDQFATDPAPWVAGDNIIAIEVHQRNSSSSDAGFDMSATATNFTVAPGNSVHMEWNSDWDSGALSPFVADITPPSAALSVGSTYRARVRHSDTTGRWSHWSAPLEFVVSASDLTPWTEGLVVSEIMYHPAPPTAAELAADPTLTNGEFEWLEIMNIGDAALSLSDIRFTKGIDFDFINGTATSIAPGQRLVLVANEAAFNLRYGHASTPDFVIGTFTSSLSNGGERLKLSFGGGTPIRDFEYDDESPWPTTPDGEGAALVLRAPETLPDHGVGQNWRASGVFGGTPGTDDRTTFTGDPLGDDNGNRIPNLVEYAAGSEFAIGTTEIAGSIYPTLTIARNAAAEDALVSLEVSADLVTWADASAQVEVLSESFSPDGTLLQTWRSTTPATAASYLRVRVELP